MKKRIALFVLAIVCGLSLTIASVVSVFAGFYNGSFEVNEVLTNYDEYKAVQTSNAGVVDLSGQYQITVEYGPAEFYLGSAEPLLLFDAPDGYFVYYRNDYFGGLGSLYDRILIKQTDSTTYLIGEIGGSQYMLNYSIPGTHTFIVPQLPNYGDGEQNKVFMSADFVTVYKLGDVDPVPPAAPGDGVVYENIDDVWSDLWGNMTAWLGDADKYFLTDGSLTALGLCCAIPIGVGVVMLLVHIIMKFLRLRG